MDSNAPKPAAIHSFYYGTLYSLSDALKALVPSTYMNLSGKVVAEAKKAGLPIERMLVIYDDKDLPLGTGRIRRNGRSAGHRGLQSIMDELGTDDFFRLRLGIGPFQRPLKEWVLEEWTEGEWEIIGSMDDPFSRLMSKLPDNMCLTELQNRVNGKGYWVEVIAKP
jgi:PTH1 family peptidyl-tRNA hydrolase